MHSMSDEQESVVLTFWETKEDMDAFYSPANKIVASFLERARPFMEGAPERSDYSVEELAMQ
jgi:heme-degrading monooxygenase HmoA